MPFKLGPLNITLILVIVLVIFVVDKLPQIGSALGKTMKVFKTGQADEDEEEVKPRPRTRKKTVKKPAGV